MNNKVIITMLGLGFLMIILYGWGRNKVITMLGLGLLVLIAYAWGIYFHGCYAGNVEIYNNGWAEWIYNFIGLFFHADFRVENPDYSIPLQFARIVAPFVVILTAVFLIFEKIKDGIRLQNIKWASSKKTVVVFGLGGRGFPYILSCLENKQNVIVIESNRDNPYLDAVKRAGAAVLFGDAGRDAKSLLDTAAIKKSSKLALFTGDNGLNISVAMIASKMTEDASDGSELEIICHVDNPSASRL